eukprot:3070977-Pleurochrysis_carterae.AAC.1
MSTLPSLRLAWPPCATSVAHLKLHVRHAVKVSDGVWQRRRDAEEEQPAVRRGEPAPHLGKGHETVVRDGHRRVAQLLL